MVPVADGPGAERANERFAMREEIMGKMTMLTIAIAVATVTIIRRINLYNVFLLIKHFYLYLQYNIHLRTSIIHPIKKHFRYFILLAYLILQ